MAESGFEAALDPPARRLYELLDPEDQRIIDGILADLEANPYPDGRRTFLLAEVPERVAFYAHPRWWVLYRLAEPGHVAITAIAPPLSPPEGA